MPRVYRDACIPPRETNPRTPPLPRSAALDAPFIASLLLLAFSPPSHYPIPDDRSNPLRRLRRASRAQTQPRPPARPDRRHRQATGGTAGPAPPRRPATREGQPARPPPALPPGRRETPHPPPPCPSQRGWVGP